MYVFRPHKGPWFSIPTLKKIKGIKVAVKYAYMLDANIKGYLLYMKPWRRESLKHNIKELILAITWCILNKRSLFKIRFVMPSDESLFFFHHGNLATLSDIKTNEIDDITSFLSELKCRKICHVTHIQYDLERGLANLAKVNPEILVGEGDPRPFLSDELKNIRFKLLPFVIKNRFLKKTDNTQARIEKILLTGTIAPPINDAIFVNKFKTDCLQPDRLFLFLESEKKNFFKCLISNNYNESESELSLNNQKKYFSTNILDEYKKHKFAIVTSEIIGIPAIGLFEAMASGCIIISKDQEILTQYGMLKNEHYIYVDSYENLDHIFDIDNEKVHYIRNNSVNFSKEKFCITTMIKNLESL